MKHYRLEDIKPYTQRAGFTGHFVHGEGMSITHWEFKKGSELEPHAHPHEQITFMLKGCLQFNREGQEPLLLKAGEFLVFKSNELHGGVALEDSIALDAFHPVREDLIAAQKEA